MGMVFGKVADVHIGRLIAGSRAVTKETHGQLLSALEKIWQTHGISHPPALHLHPHYRGAAAAIADQNIIIASEHHLTGLPQDQQLFSAAHETGHILAGHTGPSTKQNELLADRLAVQLMGSKAAAIAFRTNAHESKIAFQQNLQQATGKWGKPALRFRKWLEDGRTIREYGTIEEQLASIEATNLAEQTLLKKLIAGHNQRYSR